MVSDRVKRILIAKGAPFTEEEMVVCQIVKDGLGSMRISLQRK
jgi:hypothetical protein